MRRLAALAVLILPPWVAVQSAIAIADRSYGPLESLLQPVLSRLGALPSLPAALLAGDYGLAAMLPFLFLYALPTAVIFAVLAEAYRQAGLLERLGHELHPWTQRLGLEGKDLITVVMGFGCNVPALHQARACRSCTKEACMSAIAFGAACSYQHPATLAVLAAAGRADLAPAYLGLLVLSTAGFLRFFYGGPRSAVVGLIAPAPGTAWAWPSLSGLHRHAWAQGLEFCRDVATVFAGVCLLAAFAAWSGLLGLLESGVAPIMRLLRLPDGVAGAVVMSAVRKNGMATVLIDPAGGLKVPLPAASQLLAAVLLAGMVLPCVVTSLALGREVGWKRCAQLLLRQMGVVLILVAGLSWSGHLFGW